MPHVRPVHSLPANRRSRWREWNERKDLQEIAPYRRTASRSCHAGADRGESNAPAPAALRAASPGCSPRGPAQHGAACVERCAPHSRVRESPAMRSTRPGEARRPATPARARTPTSPLRARCTRSSESHSSCCSTSAKVTGLQPVRRCTSSIAFVGERGATRGAAERRAASAEAPSPVVRIRP